MPDENTSNFKSIRDSIQELSDRAEVARNEGNRERLRQALERKRHLQNRLAFLIKAQECDEACSSSNRR
jgi:hypothetical protein